MNQIEVKSEKNQNTDSFPSVEENITYEVFCDELNISHCAAYISEQLLNLGLSLSPLTHNDGTVHYDAPALFNALYDVIKLHSKHLRDKEAEEDRIRRIQLDFEYNLKEIRRLREKIERCERTIQTEKEKNRQLELKLKSLQTGLKTEKDETKRLQSIIQQRDAQFHHELRRKDKELATLKDHLHQTMNDKGGDRRVGLMILNNVPRPDTTRSKWQTKSQTVKNEDDVQKRILSSYEKRNQLLLEENDLLRETLQSSYANLQSAIMVENKTDPIRNGKHREEVNELFENRLSPKHFQLPYTQVKNKIESVIQALLTHLIKQTTDAKDQMLKSNHEQEPSKTVPSNLLENIDQHSNETSNERDTFLKEKLEFEEMKRAFLKEQGLISDAATDLVKDKQPNLEDKRSLFEWRANQESTKVPPTITIRDRSDIDDRPFDHSSTNGTAIIDDFNQMLREFESLAKEPTL